MGDIEKLIIKKKDVKNNMTITKINTYLKNIHNILKFKKSTTFVFDIHNTTEYENNKIDIDVYNFIKIYHKKYNIFFLSYDGNDNRIETNEQILNSYSNIFKNIPKIFVKERGYKGKILFMIDVYMKRHDLYTINNKYNMYFIDDNINNINDAKNIINNCSIKLFTLNYSKHSKHKDLDGVDNIGILKEYIKY
jgi:hypothetical protein